jgi:hypothetical protein
MEVLAMSKDYIPDNDAAFGRFFSFMNEYAGQKGTSNQKREKGGES